MEFKNGVFNAARDGNLRRLKVGLAAALYRAREPSQREGVRQGDSSAECGAAVCLQGREGFILRTSSFVVWAVQG